MTHPQIQPTPGDDRREDEVHLASLEAKLQLVRDRIKGVVRGYGTGLFLYGIGGIGKSYTVIRELENLQANYKLFNSRMTGRGLYNALEKFPDAVHLLEDIEQLQRDSGAQGVLRSAFWAQRKDGDTGQMVRLVTWTTFRQEHSFVFTGGVIILSNIPLHRLPQLDAVKTRIAYLHLEVSDQEVRALMRKIAAEGYESQGRHLEPDVCQEVCEYLIQQSRGMHRPLDIRLLMTSFEDRLMWEEGESACHWKDLVNSRVREGPTDFKEAVDKRPRDERRMREVAIIREIFAATNDSSERVRLWKEPTGKSRATLYRLTPPELKKRFLSSDETETE
jgi:hypothetical protein